MVGGTGAHREADSSGTAVYLSSADTKKLLSITYHHSLTISETIQNSGFMQGLLGIGIPVELVVDTVAKYQWHFSDQ